MIFLIYLAVVLMTVIGLWKMFEKAGQPGWASIIPIYNLYVMIKIAGRSGWFMLLLLIPLINFIVGCIIMNDISKKFGQGAFFTLGLIFLGPIFFMILGLGDAQYSGTQVRLAAG